MMNLFVTFSCADLHSNEIHEKIPGSESYLNKTIVSKVEDIPTGANRSDFLTKHEDFMLRAKAVDANADLVVSYFCTKVEAFIQEVLTVTIGVKDWIVRYEFQSRGSIHAHCMFSTINGPSSIDLETGLEGSPPPPDDAVTVAPAIAVIAASAAAFASASVSFVV